MYLTANILKNRRPNPEISVIIPMQPSQESPTNNDIYIEASYFGKRPKILIAMDTMMCGGIEKSLISLLNSLDNSRLDITLALNKKSGEFLKFIPEWIKIIELQYRTDINREKNIGRSALLRKELFHFRWFSFLRKYRTFKREERMPLTQKWIHRFRRYHNEIISNDITHDKFDLAVAYANTEQIIFVADKIYANRKIAFFHTELSGLCDDIRYFNEILSKFDTIYGVSNELIESIKIALPQYRERIKLFPHIINADLIKSLAQEYKVLWSDQRLKILSVGRIQKQKGFDLIPDIAKELKDKGIDFIWYIIGDGSLKKTLNEKISEFGLNDNIHLTGILSNPYPYFASCDIYVQPSRYEGYCLTLAEARVFAKPIVSTRFNGAMEQLENGRFGKIVNCDVDEIADAIFEINSNELLRNTYINALNEQEIASTQGTSMFINEISLAAK